MADPIGQGTDTVVSDAFVAARELLLGAEEEAARLRADVDRYVRQREQEAELLVGKARRLLALAEERAASLEAGDASRLTPIDSAATSDQVAGSAASAGGAVADAALARAAAISSSDRSLDLDALDALDGPPRSEPTGLDGVLASAIAKALDRSFPRLR